VFLELLQQRSKRDGGRDGMPRCHFFNTFFFAKLAPPRGYDYKSVARWTRRLKVRRLCHAYSERG
jgi:Ulp1 family protease